MFTLDIENEILPDYRCFEEADDCSLNRTMNGAQINRASLIYNAEEHHLSPQLTRSSFLQTLISGMTGPIGFTVLCRVLSSPLRY
jgi:hypothetical protein